MAARLEHVLSLRASVPTRLMTDDVLTAPLVIEYPFTPHDRAGRRRVPHRAARGRSSSGIKGGDGRVLVPPTEYDPVTGEELTELVEVGPRGDGDDVGVGRRTRAQGTRSTTPSPGRSIQLDGADTADAPRGRRRLRSTRCPPACGSTPRWARRARGPHHRPRLLRPEADAERLSRTDQSSARPSGCGTSSRCVSVRTPAELDYTLHAGRRPTPRSSGASPRGRSSASGCPGARRSTCRPAAPARTDGVPTTRAGRAAAHAARSSSFCVVNVQFYGQAMEIPYASALILLDGADLPIMHLIQECPVDQVRIGMRVEAVWVARRRARPDPREHQVVPAHRRARRRRSEPAG